MPAKKANLMIDEELIRRICDYASLKQSDRVLEIGAGTGNLSAELAKRAGTVYAVERDARSCSFLEKRFSEAKNVEIICADALKIGYPSFDKIVSNLPYEISRKVTERILSVRFGLAVLVFQKEYAEKLSAEPGNGNYRFISALAQFSADIEVLEIVPAKAFRPAPRVQSAVVRLRQKEVPEAGFVDFLHKVFNYRNKKLKKLFPSAEGLPDTRGSRLSPEELRKVYLDFCAEG